MLAIDQCGLDEMDKKILSVIIDHHSGGPVGVSTMAVAVGEEVATIAEVYEPYLIMQGFLKKNLTRTRSNQTRLHTLRKTIPTSLLKEKCMKTIVNLTLEFFAGLSFQLLPRLPQATDFSQKSKPATVKVLLHRTVPELHFEAKGHYDIYYPLNETKVSSGINSKRHMTCRRIRNKWGEDFKGYHQLRFVPSDTQSSFWSMASSIEDALKSGCNDGKLNVINEVGVEPYLNRHCHQFSQPMHDEVMNAIAIVARTNAYFIGYRNKQAAWHVRF